MSSISRDGDICEFLAVPLCLYVCARVSVTLESMDDVIVEEESTSE